MLFLLPSLLDSLYPDNRNKKHVLSPSSDTLTFDNEIMRPHDPRTPQTNAAVLSCALVTRSVADYKHARTTAVDDARA
jgi:hypothetical protein